MRRQKHKSILALLLAGCMIFSFGSTGFAEETAPPDGESQEQILQSSTQEETEESQPEHPEAEVETETSTTCLLYTSGGTAHLLLQCGHLRVRSQQAAGPGQPLGDHHGH